MAGSYRVGSMAYRRPASRRSDGDHDARSPRWRSFDLSDHGGRYPQPYFFLGEEGGDGGNACAVDGYGFWPGLRIVSPAGGNGRRRRPFVRIDRNCFGLVTHDRSSLMSSRPLRWTWHWN